MSTISLDHMVNILKNNLPIISNFYVFIIVISVGLVVPIVVIFLSFLMSYGLLEFLGVLMQAIIKPPFKTSCKSTVDAIASFAGIYYIALLITFLTTVIVIRLKTISTVSEGYYRYGYYLISKNCYWNDFNYFILMCICSLIDLYYF